MSTASAPDAEQAQDFSLTPYEDGRESAQVDLFGSVDAALTLEDVQRGIRGVSRPRDLRPLVQKSTHDPLMNMLELAMKAKQAGKDELAFSRFAECLPYIWTKVSGQGIAAMLEGAGQAGGAGQITYAWMAPQDAQQ